jgi:hypothetical protein
VHFQQQCLECPIQWGIFNILLTRGGSYTTGSGAKSVPVERALSYVAFRGSDSFVDALIDAAAIPVTDYTTGVKLHSAIASVMAIQIPVIAATLKAKLVDPRAAFVLTGHSLGGAYASVAAMQLTGAATRFDVFPASFRQLVTFGSPLVWATAPSARFTDEAAPFRELSSTAHHFVFGHDIVPRLLGHPLASTLRPILAANSTVPPFVVSMCDGLDDVASNYTSFGNYWYLPAERDMAVLPYGCSLNNAHGRRIDQLLKPTLTMNCIAHHNMEANYVTRLLKVFAR